MYTCTVPTGLSKLIDEPRQRNIETKSCYVLQGVSYIDRRCIALQMLMYFYDDDDFIMQLVTMMMNDFGLHVPTELTNYFQSPRPLLNDYALFSKQHV